MQKEYVGDDGGLNGFCWPSANPVQDAGTHEAIVILCARSPYHGPKTNSDGKYIHWTPAEGSADGDPISTCWQMTEVTMYGLGQTHHKKLLNPKTRMQTPVN
jgi:hypothetical protein